MTVKNMAERTPLLLDGVEAQLSYLQDVLKGIRKEPMDEELFMQLSVVEQDLQHSIDTLADLPFLLPEGG
jgi:hypothetical protein